MTEIPLNKATSVEIDFPLVEITEQELADLNAEYQVLLVKLLNDCNQMTPTVSMAALFSAAGCIAVQTMTQEDAKKYLAKCGMDVILRLPEAYAQVKQGSDTNGGNAGEESKDSH